MKALSEINPWGSSDCQECESNDELTKFEDSFVVSNDSSRLSDSDQYLARLYSRLKNVQGGTTQKDLVNSLSQVKEDTIARLMTNGERLEAEEEAILDANPLLRHITPHLQAMAPSELVHLLKADVLQAVTDEQLNQADDTTNKSDDDNPNNDKVDTDSLQSH